MAFPATGLKALRKIQLGAEGTAGNVAAATAILRANGTIRDGRSLVFPEVDIGQLAPSSESYTASYLGELDQEAAELSFEQLYPFEAGIEAETPTPDSGSGSGYVRTYEFPTTAQKTVRTYTIQNGDNIEADIMAYGFVKQFTIEGKGEEALKIAANWAGRAPAPGSFTGSLVPPALEYVMFNPGKFYINDAGSAIGNTQVSNTLLGMNLTVKTGWRPTFTADGSLNFSFIKCVRNDLDILLNLTFEHNASSIAEKVKWRAETMRWIRLKFEGTTLVSAGSYSKKTF